MLNKKQVISVVVPIFNESESIPLFLSAFHETVLDDIHDWEVIFIDDGSTDHSLQILQSMRAQDQRIKYISLSRNFGKEIAMAAGLEHAAGEAVIIMDVDLQDPPELVHDFLRLWHKGYDTVVGVRSCRKEDGALKKISAEWFYRTFNRLAHNKITRNAGDYRLLDRSVVNALNSLPERVRFTKGLFGWVGFNRAEVPFVRPERCAGSTKWNFWKLWNFAIDGFTGFSTIPLRAWSYIGLGIACISFIYALIIITKTVIFGVDLPGYASIMVVLLGLGGIILISLGIIGEYLGRIYEEVKQRPLYLIKSSSGLKCDTEDHDNVCCN